MLAIRFLKEHTGVITDDDSYPVGHVMDVPDDVANALIEQDIVECIENGEPELKVEAESAPKPKAKGKAKAK